MLLLSVSRQAAYGIPSRSYTVILSVECVEYNLHIVESVKSRTEYNVSIHMIMQKEEFRNSIDILAKMTAIDISDII